MGLKLVIVGEEGVGKTSLLTAFVKGEFSADYTSGLFECGPLDMEVRGKSIELVPWDTMSHGNLAERLLPLYYHGSHAFLLCFSIDSAKSFSSITERWDPQIKFFGGRNVPRFLVACKKDLRDDRSTVPSLESSPPPVISTAQGKKVAHMIGATYFECSSKTGENVRELFLQVTESMDAEKVAWHSDGQGHHRWRYRNSDCVIV